MMRQRKRKGKRKKIKKYENDDYGEKLLLNGEIVIERERR